MVRSRIPYSSDIVREIRVDESFFNGVLNHSLYAPANCQLVLFDKKDRVQQTSSCLELNALDKTALMNRKKGLLLINQNAFISEYKIPYTGRYDTRLGDYVRADLHVRLTMKVNDSSEFLSRVPFNQSLGPAEVSAFTQGSFRASLIYQGYGKHLYADQVERMVRNASYRMAGAIGLYVLAVEVVSYKNNFDQYHAAQHKKCELIKDKMIEDIRSVILTSQKHTTELITAAINQNSLSDLSEILDALNAGNQRVLDHLDRVTGQIENQTEQAALLEYNRPHPALPSGTGSNMHDYHTNHKNNKRRKERY